MKTAKLKTIAPGTLISYRDRHATVLEHLPQGVFIQLNDPIEDRAFGKTNDWRGSDLQQYLNGEFARLLCAGNMDELLDTVTDLTAMDGTTDYGSSVDKVTLLTVDQCRRYRYTRPRTGRGYDRPRPCLERLQNRGTQSEKGPRRSRPAR